jgi:hypothetical protein
LLNGSLFTRDFLTEGIRNTGAWLGRAGMIAARLLAELGIEPATAIRRVRAVRPGAIETRQQEKYVLGIGVGIK